MIFKNIKILDLTRVLSGPLATRHFAQQGAEVIKVEPPAGDDTRQFPPLVNGWSGYFETLNHNKKSIVLNLKLSSDLEVFYKLCRDVDVIVENFSPIVKYKLKIGYPEIRKINPKIIYASLCGISKDSNCKYYDIIAQAESGLISINQTNSKTAIVDSFAGMKLAFAIASALYNREKTNEGECIIVSMLGAAFDMLEQNLIESSVSGLNNIENTSKNTYSLDTAICPFGVFYTKTEDIAIGIGNENLWKTFCEYMKQLDSEFDLANFNSNQLRLDNIELIYSTIQNVFDNHLAQKINENLNELGIPSGIVSSMKEILSNDKHFEHKLLQRIKIEGVGFVVVPTGGILFENNPDTKYTSAPKLNQNRYEF
jgi:CoA:oxalate CoA-transferase